MLYQEKSFEYPKIYILVLSAGIFVSAAMVILGIYILFSEDFLSGGWSGIFVVSVCTVLLIGCIFEMQNANTILVNERELIALRGKERVVIPWSSIEHIYYTASRGPGAPEPMYSLYIFSKTNDFIIIRQETKGFSDFVGILKQYSPKDEAEHIPFLRLVAIFVRIYLFGKSKANLPS